jgi:hypothetical protein
MVAWFPQVPTAKPMLIGSAIGGEAEPIGAPRKQRNPGGWLTEDCAQPRATKASNSEGTDRSHSEKRASLPSRSARSRP